MLPVSTSFRDPPASPSEEAAAWRHQRQDHHTETRRPGRCMNCILKAGLRRRPEQTISQKARPEETRGASSAHLDSSVRHTALLTGSVGALAPLGVRSPWKASDLYCSLISWVRDFHKFSPAHQVAVARRSVETAHRSRQHRPFRRAGSLSLERASWTFCTGALFCCGGE